MKKRIYDDDDGRQIADMSCLDSFKSNAILKNNSAELPDNKNIQKAEPLTKEETSRLLRSSLLAGLSIGIIFIAGAALLILFLLLIWGKL